MFLGSEYLLDIVLSCLERTAGPQKNWKSNKGSASIGIEQRQDTDHADVGFRVLVNDGGKDSVPIGSAEVSGCTEVSD